ncbi:Protein FAR1-RELATED SEQUENCE 6 [Zea mays]|uniref:Protein FAR1-RELATED SEQUENCE 6 n=1 Tax=Zea mays TaxID=4577 RepID=A0A1D6LBM7_MAIZE|nr:Protein FAR1-RELATED SEQUENCE 6 [Zea mays]
MVAAAAAAETVELDDGGAGVEAAASAAAAASSSSAAARYGDDRTPRDGMVFKSYEEVLNFYKRYALRTGFGVCVKKSSFTKAGLCRRLVLVCNKWGNGKEDACYQARPTAKTNCQATVVARLLGDDLLHLTDVNLEHNHALNPSAARFLRCYKTLPSGLSKDLVFLRLVEIGMVSDEKYRHAVRLLKDMKETLLDDNLCRDLEQKLTPAERAIVNGDNHTQPGSSEGGAAKKRRGRPPKKNKEINMDSMDPLLVSSDVTQKDTFHSASTTSNLGTHVRTHGIVDLMEEVNPSELSFDSRYGVQSGHSHHFGNRVRGPRFLDFGAPMT